MFEVSGCQAAGGFRPTIQVEGAVFWEGDVVQGDGIEARDEALAVARDHLRAALTKLLK